MLIKDRNSKKENLSIVNRLDSETSGLVVVAKNSHTSGLLGSLFEKRLVEKEYRAIVIGKPEQEKGVWSWPLGFGVYEDMFRFRLLDDSGEKAETNYELLKTFSKKVNNKSEQVFSLLAIRPLTGRTHQIRIHSQLAGLPIAGDKIYINPEIFKQYCKEGWKEEMAETVILPRLALHAFRLKFLEPRTGQSLEFKAPIPELFTNFLLL